MTNCELCRGIGGELIWRNDAIRVIRVLVSGYPGFCRVVSQSHLSEMSDLSLPEQQQMMHIVFATEAALRQLYRPDKINLASLGNAVPHLHWHVIPRWHDDPHFPLPVWAAPLHPENFSVVRPDVTLADLQYTLVNHLGREYTLNQQ